MLNKPEKLDQWFKSARILAGTGHRPDKLGKEYDLKGKYSTYLRKEIKKCFILLRVRKLISGMALGFDQICAITAIENNIKVVAAIPCDNQEAKWIKSSRDLYYSILENPLVTSKIVSPGPYHISKMSIRNEYMVDNSDAIIAAWDGSDGGTANCVRYAEKMDKLIYQINPSDAPNLAK